MTDNLKMAIETSAAQNNHHENLHWLLLKALCEDLSDLTRCPKTRRNPGGFRRSVDAGKILDLKSEYLRAEFETLCPEIAAISRGTSPKPE